MKLLQPTQKLNKINVSGQKRGRTYDEDEEKSNSTGNCENENHGTCSNNCSFGSVEINGDSTLKGERKRLVTILHHVTMSTDFFVIVGIHGSINRSYKYNTKSRCNSGYSLDKLSHSVWRNFARYVAEELNHISSSIIGYNDSAVETSHSSPCCDTSGSTIREKGGAEHDDENDDGAIDINIEGCHIATTSTLYKLTKHRIDTLVSTDQRLSEEDFSIIVLTILRLLGHPNEYWTKLSREWITKMINVSIVGGRLRLMLLAIVVCSSLVPAGLPAEDHDRAIVSLRDILSSTNKIRKVSAITQHDLLQNPWDNFWYQ